MQKYFISIIILIFIVLSSSCRKNFDTIVGNSDFRLEKDTLFLDSVFTNIASHTYHVKIYNTSKNDITLNEVKLANGDQSFYRINVDGISGKSAKNVLIHAQDSIFVFVEVTADINQLTDPIYEEKLIVEDNGKTDDVLLTAFVKDAYFLYPQRFPDGRKDSITTYTDPNTGATSKVAGYFLPNDTTFTADKSIVVYGHVAVSPGKTLTIDPDTHLYFHFNSGLIVWEDASLHVNGSLGHEVIFEDDRMEPDFENRANMWNYIWLRNNSKDNQIDFAIIKNAQVGIVSYANNLSQPILNINNSQIYNCSVGIFGFGSHINAHNLVMNNFAGSALLLLYGGNYDLKHCSITNYGNGIRNKENAAIYVNNYFVQDEVLYPNDLTQFNLSNSIIYGNSGIEFYLDKDDNALFNYQVNNSLIRFVDTQGHFNNIPEVDFTDASHYQNILLNQDPIFQNTQENKIIIGDTSPAINQGNILTAQQVPLDILGVDRTTQPDLGAYQHITFPN